MRFTGVARRPTYILTLADLERGVASDRKLRHLCTAVTMAASSPPGFIVPLTSDSMANSSSTKATDGLHLHNPSLSLYL